jgi:hypothetical protein
MAQMDYQSIVVLAVVLRAKVVVHGGTDVDAEGLEWFQSQPYSTVVNRRVEDLSEPHGPSSEVSRVVTEDSGHPKDPA